MLRPLFALALLAGVLGSAVAQQPVSLPTDLPPLSVPPVLFEGPILPNGTTVSQPLQESLPDPLLDPVPRIVRTPEVARGPIPKSWSSGEVLILWTQPQNLPPLLTASRSDIPTLGGPNTVLLLGGGRSDPPPSTGARFVLGWSMGTRSGLEISYLFTGTQTSHDRVGPSGVILGRPVLHADTGLEDVIPVNTPSMPGTFRAWSSTRVQSWGVTALTNFFDGENLTVHGLIGYRYFMLNGGLRFEQDSSFRGIDSTFRSSTADQIDAHNRFHGGELGLRSELTRGPFSLQLETKVALGKTVEVVRVGGQTVGVIDGIGGTTTQWFNGGVFGQPSNSGRTVHSHFGVLPEGGLKLGYKYGDRARFSVGYTVVYLSDAVRPADQIDRTVDLNQFGGASGERPAPLFVRSDFWIQGVTLGMDWRY